MQISTLDDSSIWDDFVDSSPYGTLFHKWDFLKTIEKHTGYILLPYGIYVKDTLAGVFPAFLKSNYRVSAVFSPPPRTGIPYMGFIMSSDYVELTQNGKEARLKEIVKGITEKLDKLSPVYLSIQLPSAFSDIREFKWNDYSVDPLFTYYIPTDASLDDILKGFSRSTKRLIRGINSKKFGIEMVQSTELAPFFDLLSRRYKEQGLKLPIISMEYLADLLHLYPDNIRLYYVYDEEGVIVGSNLAIMYKNKLISWLGTPKPDVNLPVNEFIFWEFIKMAKNTNSVFEIGGADTRRLCSFKSHFNPSLETSYRVFRRSSIGVVAEWAYLNLYKKSSSLT
ncbi:GNAT family N-acetyltransferase [Methanolobus chelungpuianus]|uniref:BioF2-like acetyltransferase domain-containing protein n=1 Tax=Methanolobus chelungpuianus TaxID=502115 RepID=A0AAE3KZG7_9EURY|nr:GNAT family N-acetyltransferase [Methanolobus chelungpuianus]MCQ6963394.1 hypothetical protein [Methanolobus chelungpuianus]